MVEVAQPQRQVGVFGAPARARHPLALDRIVGFAHARGVDQRDGKPRRSSATSTRSRVVPGMAETIDTSRRASAFISVDLPTLGGPAMTTVKPSRSRSPAEAPASAARIRARRLGDDRARRVERQRVGVLDVGKVDLRLDIAIASSERGADRLGVAAQRAAGDAQRLAPLRLGLGVDEVGEALDLGQIELAVLERAPGEFARLGRTQAGQARERGDDAGDRRAAAGHLQLRHLLAGEAARRDEADDQRAVERLAAGGIAQHSPASRRGRGTPCPAPAPPAPPRKRGPETRTTAIAARPAPEAGAKIVSRERERKGARRP